MKWSSFSLMLVLLGFARPALGCEPVIPVMHVFTGSILAKESLVVLLGAVAIKTVIFAIYEKSIAWYKAVLFMIVANCFSSVVGFSLSIAVAPYMLPIILPFLLFVCWIPSKRIIALNPGGHFSGWNHYGLAVLVMISVYASWYLFGAAQSAIGSRAPLHTYWVLKFLYIYSAIIISFALTTLWEEWVISGLSKISSGKDSFLKSVAFANLITLLAVMLYAAGMMLPIRLKSGNFLVQLVTIFKI
ncbi:MAG: hypothetical protein PVF56_25160 [Desulfobacterales bacterium]|jgi:hypothetical protein